MASRPQSAEELYDDQVRRLPLKEQLRLAALILNEALPAFPPAQVDEGEAWSEEDVRDLLLSSLHYAAQADPEG